MYFVSFYCDNPFIADKQLIMWSQTAFSDIKHLISGKVGLLINLTDHVRTFQLHFDVFLMFFCTFVVRIVLDFVS